MNSIAQKQSIFQPSLKKIPLVNKQVNKVRESVLQLHSVAVTIDYNIVHNQRFLWKKMLDVVMGGIGMVLFMIIFPVIALAIKLSSKGPVIFKQKRTGFDGSEFACYKFRTMHCNQQKSKDEKPDITKVNDERVFAFGEFLRKTNLDEIPQFINILKGEMSLVGPRPYPVQENSYWNSTFPEFYKRNAVKPGLTGLAQANGYRGGTMNLKHMSERLKRDLTYVKNRSLYMDIKLIAVTVQKMVSMKTEAH
jgi:putative colanic acid biosynthesis UDP-glucose lipid carrier transferase